MGTLTETELATRAGATQPRIRRMVELRLLEPDDHGRFADGDVRRAQIVLAYERGGITLDDLARAVAERHITFDYSDRIYPEASPLSGRTAVDLARELGYTGEQLVQVLLALGLSRPTLDRPLTQADERVLPAFFAAWSGSAMSADAPVRAARLLGDSTRRAAEGWVNLFMDAIGLPLDERVAMSVDALRARMFEPAVRVAQVFEPMLVWLLRRHLEQALNALNVETMERALDAHGVRPRPIADPPAIVFADLSGFTRLTEEHGDELGVRHASKLADLAGVVAATHDGRLVKQLGDGVMLAFERVADAVGSAGALRAAAVDADLPPLHIGVSAGPVVERDGDYYGRTVNLAARICSVAAPGEILANQTAADAAQGASVEPLGAIELKGIPAPVALFRVDITSGSRSRSEEDGG